MTGSEAASSPSGYSLPGAKGLEHAVPVDAVAFFVVVLVLGVFTSHMLAFTRLPYTALLLVGQTFLLRSHMVENLDLL